MRLSRLDVALSILVGVGIGIAVCQVKGRTAGECDARAGASSLAPARSGNFLSMSRAASRIR